MKILGLDLSLTCCAASIIEEGHLLEYLTLNFDSPEFSEMATILGEDIVKLHNIKEFVIDLIKKHNIGCIMLEDIYLATATVKGKMSINLEAFAKLCKIQGVVDELMYQIMLDFPTVQYHKACASEIRRHYDLNLGNLKSYRKYLNDDIIIRKYFRLQAKKLKTLMVKGKVAKKQKWLSRLRKVWKYVKSKIKHYIKLEYGLAKKQKVIDYVNIRYNLQLKYEQNDTADAILIGSYANDYIINKNN